MLPALAKLAPPALQRKLNGPDLVLAILVMAVVGLMIIPLPTWLLDLLLTANLASSVAILLVSLYVSDALKIAAFPSLLLLTTLIRLALNVSSTRLILLQADAGEVISAFGNFVVRGNYVVGAVIFLILTIIQFVVIAKGSERVAEVGARFTLDAMPGKQMAIDADLRAGAIDNPEARRRRKELERQSQFYGAMDGAMKFVKGDTIAAFIITLVNIGAGVAIGVGQRHMDLGVALKRYGLLAIGDGLVAQIPALVIATAAGILVTRVTSEDGETSLGTDLSAQLLGQPKALLASGALILILGVIPGLPALPFLVIGSLLIAASRARTRSLAESSISAVKQPVEWLNGQPRFLPMLAPWSVGFGRQPASEQPASKASHSVSTSLTQAVASARAQIFSVLGVPVPIGTLELNPSLGPDEVLFSVHELPVRRATLPEGLSAAAVSAWLTTQLTEVFQERAFDFIGHSETQQLLDALESVKPGSTRQLVPKPLSVPVLSEVLRTLVQEQVSIRDLSTILDALTQAAAVDKPAAELAELARSALKRSTTHRLAGDAKRLQVYLLDPMIEQTLKDSTTKTSAGQFLSLAPAASRDIVRAIANAIQTTPPPAGSATVILTQPAIRRFVRGLLEVEYPNFQVVSFADLLQEVVIQPLGTVTLKGI